ncbi:hypothetical protein RFI_35398 [Reticulomyxa filosa]|uniref:Uncharacterized protein n=1 Tax=Reticulomyxa filosa TaxID=46433 RepID=X6LJB8_RETFI|nr:hypothetical protein RFI_35398 [Reticulomyxa filosa]|eukprot:ETO02038.1 hypothetical protein RFI_35398 [Reticulomyxa filosa]
MHKNVDNFNKNKNEEGETPGIVSCDFKSAIDDHLKSNMKLHFDLVIKSFDTLQQNIRQYKVYVLMILTTTKKIYDHFE